MKHIIKTLKKSIFLLSSLILYGLFVSPLMHASQPGYKKLSEKYEAESALDQQSPTPVKFTGIAVDQPTSSVQAQKSKALAREYDQALEQTAKSAVPLLEIISEVPGEKEEKQFGYHLTFEDVAQENVKSIAKKKDKDVPTSTTTPEGFLARQKLILLEVTERIKKNVTASILKNVEGDHIEPSVIDQTTWKDLEILTGGTDRNLNEKDKADYKTTFKLEGIQNTSEIYLGSILNRTNTELGKTYFYGTLARPTADVEVLKKRQKIIKYLAQENPQLLEELNEKLAGVAQDEGQLLSFWDTKLVLPGVVDTQFIRLVTGAIDDALNKSSSLLAYSSYEETEDRCLNIALHGGASAILIAYGLISALETVLDAQIIPENWQTTATWVTTAAAAKLLPKWKQRLALLLNIPYVSCGLKVGIGIYGAVKLKSAFEWQKAYISMDAVVQHKLVSVGNFLNKMREAYEAIAKDYALAGELKYFASLEQVVAGNDPDLAQLFELFQRATFEKKADFFFNRGNTLVAWNLLHDKKVQQKLEKGLVALAEVDMYASIANLFNESQNQRVKFSFPTYNTDSETPIVNIKGYWNPFVDPAIAVKNSSLFGDTQQTRNGIISGPNSAGKSTILKSLTLAIILAQSIGIAPADAMEFTPFTYVASYMETKGSVTDKTSQFQSEVIRANELQKTIRILQEFAKRFAFVILDELFSGTSPDEGMAFAYATAEEIGKEPNGMCLIATHYELLTLLAKLTSYFTNYRVFVTQLGDIIKRHYTLEPGITEQHIALEVAKEKGVSGDLLERARQILKKVTTNKNKFQLEEQQEEQKRNAEVE